MRMLSKSLKFTLENVLSRVHMLLIRTNRPRVSSWPFKRQTSHPAPFRRVRFTRGTKKAGAPYWDPGSV
jgi:hypothetical protein